MSHSRLIQSTRVVVAIISLSLVGCSSSEESGPKAYPVTGAVTQGGKPVEGASVVFVPYGGKGMPATALTDANGKYKLTTTKSGDGAVPGSYKVKVLKWDKAPVDTSKMVRNMTYEEEQKAYNPDAKPAAPPKNLLPKKYESENTSGLSHMVAESPSTFDIDLK